jgi:regulatory protein
MREPKQKTSEQAFQQLSAACAQAEHCQQEMLDKMCRWGLDESEQASVMERLVKGRYVDDERFCRAFVRDKIKYNKW